MTARTTSGLDAHLVVHQSDTFTLDVAVRIAPGETVALLGPNGAGKSTAVAALAGLQALDAGSITLGGVTLDDPAAGVFVPSERRGVGVVLQNPMLFPHLTVLENIAFGPRSRGIDRTEARRRARRWLDDLEITELGDRRPRELSGGQAQRVALARALVTDPELLLLDEPLSALDVTARSQLRRVLADHLERHAGPRLLITHDPTEAFLLADTVHVVEGGTVTQVGDAEEIRLRPRTSYIAELAGSNLLAGRAAGGTVDVEGHPVQIADTAVAGAVLLTIHPRAIALHLHPPEGSPRNAWMTEIMRVEDLGDRARVLLGAPVPLAVEITHGSVERLHLAPGASVWMSVKATEIGVEPDNGASA